MPAFNCAGTLGSDVARLEAALREAEPSYEILLVVDGGDDPTLAVARQIESARVPCGTTSTTGQGLRGDDRDAAGPR